MKSGTLTRQAGAFQFRLHWESVPNQSANSSTITAKLYYESINAYGVLGYTDARAATILINGNASNFTYTRNIGANGSKLIGTKTYTIQHYSDGTMSTPVGFSVNFGTTWAGTYYGTVSGSETAVLDTIQRNSTLNGSVPSWYLTQEEPIITVSRPNSTYKHKVRMELYYSNAPSVQVFTSDFFETSYKIKHEDIVNQNTLNLLARNQTYFSQNVKLILYTYNSSGTHLGTNEYLGGLLSSPGPYANTTTNSINLGGTVSINAGVSGDQTNTNWYYNVSIGTQSGQNIASTQGYGSPVDVSFDANVYRDYIGQTLVMDVNVRYSSVGSNLRTGVKKNILIKAGNPPTWNTSSPSIGYQDIVSSVVNITGSNQTLVRGKSTMRVNLSGAPRATGQDGATIKEYRLTLGSTTRIYTPSTIPSFYDHPVPSNAGDSFTWSAIDSNGQEVSLTVPVRTVNYTVPRITLAKGTRQSDISKVKIDVAGTATNIGNNAITFEWGLSSGSYLNRLQSSAVHPMTGAFTASTNPAAGYPHATQGEDNSQTYYIKGIDSFGTTVSTSFRVDGLKPIMAIDPVQSTVFVNSPIATLPANIKFYVGGGAHVDGDLSVGSTFKYATSSITATSNYVQFNTPTQRYYFDKPTHMEGGLVVEANQATTLNGTLNVSGSSTLNSLTATTIDASNKITTAYNTDNGQLELASDATNYSAGLRLKRGTANTAIIEQNYSGYLNFQYDNNNYLRFGGSNSTGNTMNVNSEFLQRTHGKHTILAMANNEIWLQSSTTTMRVHGTQPGVYVRNWNDSGYNAVYASDFIKSSKREVKKNIEDAVLGTFKDDVLSTPLHRYHYLDDLDEERLRLGFMLDEVPVDNVDLRGEGLDVAAQVATLWGALQELIIENEDMKARLLEGGL